MLLNFCLLDSYFVSNVNIPEYYQLKHWKCNQNLNFFYCNNISEHILRGHSSKSLQCLLYSIDIPVIPETPVDVVVIKLQ